jgi:hypothetical protein
VFVSEFDVIIFVIFETKYGIHHAVIYRSIIFKKLFYEVLCFLCVLVQTKIYNDVKCIGEVPDIY